MATRLRLGVAEEAILDTQGNIALTYDALGRHEDALRLKRAVYSGRLKLVGQEHQDTLGAALNYAVSLLGLKRDAEVKALLRKMMPVARRVLGEGHQTTLKMRKVYAKTLYFDEGSTLDDLREAVTTLEDTERIARRVFGGAHPTTTGIEEYLGYARAALRARETPEGDS